MVRHQPARRVLVPFTCSTGPLLSCSLAAAPQVGRVALESTSAVFQAAANPSQLPTHENNKARWLLTPGLLSPARGAERAGRQQRWG